MLTIPGFFPIKQEEVGDFSWIMKNIFSKPICFSDIIANFALSCLLLYEEWICRLVFTDSKKTDRLMTTGIMTKTIAEYFKTQPVLKAWLFGSFSRGEQTKDSDVDILVQYDRTQRIGLLKIAGMHIDLENLIGRKVDIVEDGTLRPWAVDSVNNDKFLIYERTK